MSRPPRRRIRWLAPAALVLGALVWWFWSVGRERAAILSALPPQPDLAGWPDGLKTGIRSAEARATGWLRPRTGLAELASSYHANGFYPEALACYDALRRIEPREAAWPHLSAVILAGFGRLDDAVPLWQRAADLAPDYLPARIKLGDALAKANRWDEAVAAYRAALQVQPPHPHALLGLARAAVARQDWREAEKLLQEAIGRHPEFIGGLSLMVTVQEKLGNTAEAARLRAVIGRREFTDIADPWLDRTLDSCYEPYRLSVAAAVEFFSGHQPRAIALLERAIALAPDHGTYHRQLGNLLFQTDEFARARTEFERAVALSPADADAWALLVELLTHSGDEAGIDRALAVGLAQCPQSAALHHAYARRLAAAGRNEEAIREFRLAQRLRPNEANAYIGLAMVLFRTGRIDEAVGELRGALAVQPGHTLAMEVLARHSITTGDRAAARHWLRLLRDQSRSATTDLDVIAGEYRRQFGQPPF